MKNSGLESDMYLNSECVWPYHYRQGVPKTEVTTTHIFKTAEPLFVTFGTLQRRFCSEHVC